MRRIVLIVAVSLLGACATPVIETKKEAFPSFYDETPNPVTMVIVPAINRSTAADAGELISATLAQPFADNGYYVLPMPIVSQIFMLEGILDGSQTLNLPGSLFQSAFGAETVLYVTINEWETNYAVLAANVTVGLSYVLRSTSTDEVLWSYSARQVIDTTSDSSGFIIADIIATAIQTAVTDYLPIAYQVNSIAVATLPHGQYHPQYGLDGDSGVVLQDLKEGAVQELGQQ
jgi:hypothetical protein